MINGRTYLTSGVIHKKEAQKKALYIAGGIIAGLFGLMIPLGFTSNPELKPYLPEYALCMLPGLFLIWRGFKIGKQVDLARRFDGIFSTDTDGFVTLGELKQHTGLGEQEILHALEALFRNLFHKGG